MMPGRRVRVLLEHYDPQASQEEAEAFASGVAADLRRSHPGAVVVTYVEENPPADEVTG
jgi:hypothetical protein